MNTRKITLGLVIFPILLVAEVKTVSDDDLQLRKYDVSINGTSSSMVEFGGNQTPLCKLAISKDGENFFFKKNNNPCIQLTNSKGIKIICNSNKSVCKTRNELVNFIQNSSSKNNHTSTNYTRKNTTYKKTISLSSLIQNLSYDEIFDIKIKGSSANHEFHNLTEENLPFMKDISSISGDIKTINKKIKVSSKYNLNGSYKVKLKFDITQEMGMKSNLFNGWLGALADGITQVKKDVLYHTFYLNPQNSYSDIETVKFQIVGVSMNALGMNMRSNIRSYKVTNVSIAEVEEIN